MRLQLSTWPEVETYLEKSKAILIPVGSTEQHGPNGLVGTDALCPEIISFAAEDKADMLIGPTFSVGIAQHHLGFPGSMTLRPSTMIAAMKDWTDSLTRHGFERIFWFNGHGGNTATLQAAFAEIYAERSMAREGSTPFADLRLKAVNWWEMPGVMDVCRKQFPVGDGMHATASEVAVTYAGYPDQVRNVEMSPKIAPVGGFRDAANYRETFSDGRIGSDPAQATVSKGEIIIEAASSSLAKLFTSFATED
ncbi:creatininase family protein [Ponticaulis sp.]|uniref:creatininase family protein n=1 Tax=Ponticaulis sp. TaxID=2020902 RepID=UPI000B6A5DC9|nr:creatininase family protein [Ponticaulis sp.]MAI89501.1 amidase [Ponticaulis sp.]OUY00536.1 MAG: amidase [Hyphomonadaceae bacterium TMED5]|tara:strand:+ start:158572 stop:159324 length:753 start_codon:yes stop_codon:yes gene_type:complete